MQPAHDLLHVALHLARALGDRLRDGRGRIHQHVLQMREHAGLHVVEVLARTAGNGGAEAGEIIVARRHAGGRAVGAAEGQVVGLDQHLEEGIVPAHADAFRRRARNAGADPLVERGDVSKARLDRARRRARGIGRRHEIHQRAGRDAFRHCIVGACDDRRQRLGQRACRRSSSASSKDRPCSHGTPPDAIQAGAVN